MCPVAPHFSLPDSVEKYIFRHNNDLHIQHLFQYYNIIIYTDMYAELAFRKHVLGNPANKVIDLPAPMIPYGGNIHIPWTISTAQILHLVQQLVLF